MPDLLTFLVYSIKTFFVSTFSGQAQLEEARRAAGVEAWEVVKLGEVCEKISDTIDPSRNIGKINYVGLENIESNSGLLIGSVLSMFESIKSTKNKFIPGDILYGKLRPNLNKVYLANISGICSTDIYVLRAKNSINPEYLAIYLRTKTFNDNVLKGLSGAQLPRVNFDFIKNIVVTLPPMEVQREMVERIEAERAVVEANRKLMALYEAKIRRAVERVWEG